MANVLVEIKATHGRAQHQRREEDLTISWICHSKMQKFTLATRCVRELNSLGKKQFLAWESMERKFRKKLGRVYGSRTFGYVPLAEPLARRYSRDVRKSLKLDMEA